MSLLTSCFGICAEAADEAPDPRAAETTVDATITSAVDDAASATKEVAPTVEAAAEAAPEAVKLETTAVVPAAAAITPESQPATTAASTVTDASTPLTPPTITTAPEVPAAEKAEPAVEETKAPESIEVPATAAGVSSEFLQLVSDGVPVLRRKRGNKSVERMLHYDPEAKMVFWHEGKQRSHRRLASLLGMTKDKYPLTSLESSVPATVLPQEELPYPAEDTPCGFALTFGSKTAHFTAETRELAEKLVRGFESLKAREGATTPAATSASS